MRHIVGYVSLLRRVSMLYGEKVKQARQEKQLTQAELAAMANTTRQTVNLIEAGRFNPSLKLCLDIAVALGKTLDELFWLSGSGLLENINQILIADMGSTMTKVVLLEKDNGVFKLAGEAESPTTVEKPFEDVKVGLVRAFQQLEKNTGKSLVTDSGKPKIPFLATSSAGGGLQIMAFGLSSTDTGKAAQMTVLGAGGVILQTFTIDDGLTVIHKMRQIRQLHPDMILMAGGIDGGNIASVVRLAETLSLSHPISKFDHTKKIPVVFCGNKDAYPYVESILSSQFDVIQTENVRPTLTEINTEPAKTAVHDIFMEHVMEQAPGYRDVKKWVKTDIIPTPAGVEKMLMLYGEHTGKNIVMIDMGGATTDIFSNIYGDYSRTVAANTGMSYSISQVVADAGIDAVAARVPNIITKDNILDYAGNKMLNPNYLPQYIGETVIEQAIAAEGIALAWDQHQNMCFKHHQVGFLEKRRLQDDYDPFEEVFYVKDEQKLFQLSDIDTIIGAGGVIRHAQPQEALLMLADGIKPAGVIRCLRDKHFKSPQLGALSALDGETALQVFETECLEDLGWIVAPLGKIKADKPVLTVTAGDITYTVKGGEVLYLAKGGSVSVQATGSVMIRKNINNLSFEAATPVLIDCRGRGESFNGKPLSMYALPINARTLQEFQCGIEPPDIQVSHGAYTFTRELPYLGTIFARPGERVTPSTIIGENRCTPPRVYIIDIRRLVGYDKKLSDSEIKENLAVRVGDTVNSGQKIFHTKGALFGENWYESPVRGEVVRIDKALIMLREIQDYSDKPVVIKISEKTSLSGNKIQPDHIKSYLMFKEGDFIERGMQLIKPATDLLSIPSPATGTLKKIDTAEGTITIQYDNKPVSLISFVKGDVTAVEPFMSVEITGHGAVAYGMIGFGNENTGEVIEMDNNEDIGARHRGMVVFCAKPITKENLEAAKKNDVKGIIAPSMHVSEWAAFYGNLIGVGITGDEEIPFTVILTEGFGELPMTAKTTEFFKDSVGKTASLSGRTQIRAGVIRPMIVVAD